MHDAENVYQAARDGDGIGWHEHHTDVHHGCERFFRTMYNGHLLGEWIPALDGVAAKLEAGGKVADVGCGHGASTILLAKAFPNATFVGSDYHEASIEVARERAAAAGVSDRVTFEVAPATGFTGTGYDLIAMFDCLHDMGDPVGAARHVREAIAPDGTWMVVEPMAGDRVEDNLNTVGRAYYGFSTLLCTPASLTRTSVWPWARRRDRPRSATSRPPPGSRVPDRRLDPVQQRVRGAPVTRDPPRRTLLGWAAPEQGRGSRRHGRHVRDGVELPYEVFATGPPPTVVLVPPGRSSPRGSGRRRSASWPGTTG